MSCCFAERVFIEGPRGTLSARLDGPVGVPAGRALLLNPHPLMGGRMDLPLMNALAAALVLRGVVCLRFDHAGTGSSATLSHPVDVAASMARFWRTGAAPEDPMLVDEARAAADLLADIAPGPPLLVGYSFGAHAASVLAAERAVGGLGLICPTMSRHAFADPPRHVPVAVICGDADFAGDEARLTAWCGRRGPTRPVACRHLPGGHFLRGVEDAAAAFIAEELQP
jgi:alpha/beta superfamily hydrolase